jgi:RNA polymerase sigma factor (sigma-70 family)
MPTPSAFAIDVPESLLARARAGEAAAFEQLYRWFERPVFTLAVRILGSSSGDRQEAADVLQDTMLKVLGRIGDFRGGHPAGSPFWAWLRQIAVNEALMRLRSRRTHGFEVALDDEHDLADHGPLPAAAADAAQLQRAMAQLPAVTRTVLWLYHAEGYTHEEIAVLMQRTASFSKSQLARGGRRLRNLLEPDTRHDAASPTTRAGTVWEIRHA